MKNILLLSALLLVLAAPVHAMTEEANQYKGGDSRSNYADPDDAEEQFNDAPHSSYSGQSGREQQLLQGDTRSASSQTYGFGNYDNSWTRGSSFGGSSSGFYYGIR